MHSLVTKDTRTPLRVAIATAKLQADANLVWWEEEFAQLLTEIARKFYGSLTNLSVNAGCQTAEYLLSMALLFESEGSYDPEQWLTLLRTKRLHGLSAVIIARFKACHALPVTPASLRQNQARAGAKKSEAMSESVKDLILNHIQICRTKGVSAAYQHLIQLTQTRQSYVDEEEFFRWLIEHTEAGKPVLKAYHQSPVEIEAMCEELIRDILIRILPLPEKQVPLLSFHFESMLYASDQTESEVVQDFASAIKIELSPPQHAAAKEAYEKFAARVPAEFTQFLQVGGQSWFDYYVVPSSPPKPKRKRQKPT
jgi:hypothetical protein